MDTAEQEISPTNQNSSAHLNIHEIDAKIEFLAKQFEEELIEGEPREEFFEEDFDFDIAETGSEEGYGLVLRRLTRALWSGNIDVVIFLAIMAVVIRAGFRAAWRQGAAQAGVDFSELTPAEIGALEGEIAVDVGNLSSLAIDIATNSRLAGGALAPLLGRVEMWTNRIGEIRSFALRQAAANQKLMWVWNPLKEHCEDCLKYNGRVYRASVWESAGIRPRSGELACGGWRCGCSFVVTDANAMPGRPPAPTG